MISSTELAELCGVSQGTVDRALHDRPGIAPATREHVLRMAEKHGYVPDPSARDRLTGTRTLVGAVVPGSRSVFFMDLINAIREPLAAAGYRFFLSPYGDEDDFADAVKDLAGRRARALIMIPLREGMAVPRVRDAALRRVTLLNPCADASVPFLAPDETLTGRLAAETLHAHGHRSVIHVNYAGGAQAVRLRARGFAAAADSLGMRQTELTLAEPDALLDAVRRQGATAIFTHNDWLALEVMRMLAQAGMRVPEDVSLLGVDCSPSFVELCPGIASLAYPYASVAQNILRIVEGDESEAIAPCAFVPGASLTLMNKHESKGRR